MEMYAIEVTIDDNGDVRLRQPDPPDESSYIWLTKDQAKIVAKWLIALAGEE